MNGESERIQTLENELQELKRRLTAVEMGEFTPPGHSAPGQRNIYERLERLETAIRIIRDNLPPSIREQLWHCVS